MTKNMGPVDIVIRIACVAILVGVVLMDVLNGAWAAIAIAIAALLLVTCAVGVCPLYFPFKFSTLKKRNEAH